MVAIANRIDGPFVTEWSTKGLYLAKISILLMGFSGSLSSAILCRSLIAISFSLSPYIGNRSYAYVVHCYSKCFYKLSPNAALLYLTLVWKTCPEICKHKKRVIFLNLHNREHWVLLNYCLRSWKSSEVTTDLWYSMFKTNCSFRKQSIWEHGLSHSNQRRRQIWVSLYCCPVCNIDHQLPLFANGNGSQQLIRQSTTPTYLISGRAWSLQPVPRYCNAC